MHEDLIKFRKICLALLADKKIRMKEIEIDTKLSTTSLTKYLHGAPDDMPKLRASTLGCMQDFIKKHTIGFSDIPAETRTGKQEWEDKLKRDGKKEKFDDTFAEKDAKSLKLPETNEAPVDSFWHYMGQAAYCKPDNVQVVITINSKV